MFIQLSNLGGDFLYSWNVLCIFSFWKFIFQFLLANLEKIQCERCSPTGTGWKANNYKRKYLLKGHKSVVLRAYYWWCLGESTGSRDQTSLAACKANSYQLHFHTGPSKSILFLITAFHIATITFLKNY